MQFLKNLSVGRKLYGAFALVAGCFVLAIAGMLVLERSAQGAWLHTKVWDAAVAGSQMIRGTRVVMAAQAPPTGDLRFRPTRPSGRRAITIARRWR